MTEEVKPDNLTLASKPEVAPVVESKPEPAIESKSDIIPQPPIAPAPPINESEVQLVKAKDELAESIKKFTALEEKYQESQALVEKYKPCYEKSQAILKVKRESETKFITEHAKDSFTLEQLNGMDASLLESTYKLTLKTVDEANAKLEEAKAAEVYKNIGTQVEKKYSIEDQHERQKRIDKDKDFQMGKKNANEIQ